MAQPIWKDYYVDLGSEADIRFRLRIGRDVIYIGRAIKRPDEEKNLIRINNIVADYLNHSLPIDQGNFSPMQTPVISVDILDVAEWIEVDSQSFLADWSYDYNYDPTEKGMSFPINGRVDERQKLVVSEFNIGHLRVDINYRDGNKSFVIVAVKRSDDFNDDFNDDYSHSERAGQTGTAVIDLSMFTNVDNVVIGDKRYYVVQGCNRFILYYVNAYGGWDSLLIEGNHAESDSLTRHIREVEYDNRKIQNRGIHNYMNEIAKSFTLHTSWMSDDESARMHHLLNSTYVYLWDFNTEEMIPVILTDTTTEYKTYKGNGGKLVNYTINVKVAQERMRR